MAGQLDAHLENVRNLREDQAARADAEYLVELAHRWRLRHGEFKPTTCGECSAVLATVEILSEMNEEAAAKAKPAPAPAETKADSKAKE